MGRKKPFKFKHRRAAWLALAVAVGMAAGLLLFKPPPAPPPAPSAEGIILWNRELPLAESAAPPPEATPAPQKIVGRIAIIIDDMGLDRARSARAAALPAPVTLSYLPYAPQVQRQADTAAAAGHEIFLHLPWEPDDARIDAGPNHLDGRMDAEHLAAALAANLDAFTGYTGVNNHMGSRFSRDAAGLAVVMAGLKTRGVMFLDSRTTPASLAETVAREAGVPATHRDVFLDDAPDLASIRAQLQKTETLARKTGFAVAIGHPKDATLQALEEWMGTLSAKGLRAVRVGDMIAGREKIQ